MSNLNDVGDKSRNMLSENKRVIIIVSLAIAGILIAAIIIFSRNKPEVLVKKENPHITPKIITLKKALDRKIPQVKHSFSDHTDIDADNDKYLQGINKMSAQINYLSLQNELLTTKLQIAKSLKLLSSADLAKFSSMSGSGMNSDNMLMGKPSEISINIIYRSNSGYKAQLHAYGNNIIVAKGSIINNKYDVVSVNSNSVTIKDNKSLRVKTLSIRNKMGAF